MRHHGTATLTLIFLVVLGEAVGQAAPDTSSLTAWPVDSMQKVFKDDVSPTKTTDAVRIDAARNEVVSAQFVVHCAEPMKQLSCRVSKIYLDKNPDIPTPRVRYLGYVSVRNKQVAKPLRPRPCDYPDVLLDDPPANVPAKTAQPIWLTITIPPDAAPGLYQGTVDISAEVQGTIQQTSVPLAIQVYAADLPNKRTLKVSNWSWFDTPKVTAFCGVKEVYGEPFWQFLEAVAKDMAAHRQNVIFTPTTAWVWGKDDPTAAQDLIQGRADPQGDLEFDFTRFDRWVTTFQAAGGDIWIEACPLAKSHHRSPIYKSIVWKIENGKAVRREVESLSPEFEKYLSVYLPALEVHLQKRGWLNHYMQHVLDEPNGERKPTYVQVAEWFKKYAPHLKTMDAVQISDLEGAVDIWVPTLNKLVRSWDIYKERQSKGEELWFYTMGRPLEHGLTEPRLLHWASYATGTTGYLHWGYNWWVRTKDPYLGAWTLAPGDEWIVYPAPGGIRDSIRYEAMLEGIQDYELLKALSTRDPEAANAICEKLVRISPNDTERYTFDARIDALRAARRQLLQALSAGSTNSKKP